VSRFESLLKGWLRLPANPFLKNPPLEEQRQSRGLCQRVREKIPIVEPCAVSAFAVNTPDRFIRKTVLPKVAIDPISAVRC
jgi:hypothetical protein